MRPTLPSVTGHFAAFATAVLAGLASGAALAQAGELRSPQSFETIADKTERSRALFTEAGAV